MKNLLFLASFVLAVLFTSCSSKEDGTYGKYSIISQTANGTVYYGLVKGDVMIVPVSYVRIDSINPDNGLIKMVHQDGKEVYINQDSRIFFAINDVSELQNVKKGEDFVHDNTLVFIFVFFLGLCLASVAIQFLRDEHFFLGSVMAGGAVCLFILFGYHVANSYDSNVFSKVREGEAIGLVLDSRIVLEPEYKEVQNFGRMVTLIDRKDKNLFIDNNKNLFVRCRDVVSDTKGYVILEKDYYIENVEGPGVAFLSFVICFFVTVLGCLLSKDF